MPVTTQETAARRYRIEKYLTEGGMGAIYIGKKLGPGGFAKQVVLKQLLPEYTSRPEFRDLFFREAKISATLDHANIVHTFDLVESDQSLFIVMEYVRGADLRTIIRRARQRKRELSPAAAVHIALEILAGLSYAHARRDATGKSLDIIHRDVSPSNILCSVQGAAKLSDFGIAKASTYSSVFYRVRGKVGYMSPEQARSQPIDHRCDLYSLSVCLYESLTGERLFVGDLNTPADEIYGIPILPPSAKRAGLPKPLDDVLGKALASKVDDRYQNASELADALRTVAHRTGLAFSAPELAAHLRDILGSDPDRWLREEAPAASAEPQPTTVPSSDLVGTEASSIGIVVDDIPQDEPPPSVLSPKAVSGTKDFDLDSMLNDEATRPGSERQAASAPSAAEKASSLAGPAPESADLRGPRQGTPAPGWTRSTAPFPLATPKPMRTAPPPIVIRPATSRVALPGVPAPPPMSPTGTPQRPLPRATATLRAGGPPPFLPPSRVPPPPPPPPMASPIEARPAPSAFDTTEIEDATPGLMVGRPLSVPTNGHIQEPTTPRPAAPVGPPPPPLRSSPPAPYPSPAVEAAPVVLSQPETVDFSDAVTSFLPDKAGGPPGWLAIILIAVAAVGGAVLAHKATAADVAALLELEPPTRIRAAGDASDPGKVGARDVEDKAAGTAEDKKVEAAPAKAEAILEPSGSDAPKAIRGSIPTEVAGGAAPSPGKRHGGKHAKKVKHSRKHRGGI